MGIWLRVLVAINLGALAIVFARNGEPGALPAEFVTLSALVEPPMLAGLALLTLVQGGLRRMSAVAGIGAVVAIVVATTQVFDLIFAPLFDLDRGSWRSAIWSTAATLLLLAWFDLRRRAHAPAVAEARLMALTARIRPHFLFNSLNAVLGIIRDDPRRAETAIEELAGLFRALMRDNRELVPLSDEIALARQYLELEKLRLGERLRVRWDVETYPPDALVPPLMLQPLLENAVYHGIEPGSGPGEVLIRVAREGDGVLFELSNPLVAASDHRSGNQMALANIRERLTLFFDLEARLTTASVDDHYVVRITFPYRRSGRP